MDYFSRWIPLELDEASLEKGDLAGDDAEPVTARIGGILSTEALDQQGDIIRQDGIDWSYFLDKGWFNYEHQQGPDNVLGEPLKVFRDGDKTRVEGVLYLSKPKAREIYETAQAISKAKSNRRLGFSVEGAVKARNPSNPKDVLKSRVLNVAITAHPVNPEAHLELLKAMDAGYQTPSSGGGSMGAIMPQSIQGVTSSSAPVLIRSLKSIFPHATDAEIADAAKQLGSESFGKGLTYLFPHVPADAVDAAARAFKESDMDDNLVKALDVLKQANEVELGARVQALVTDKDTQTEVLQKGADAIVAEVKEQNELLCKALDHIVGALDDLNAKVEALDDLNAKVEALGGIETKVEGLQKSLDLPAGGFKGRAAEVEAAPGDQAPAITREDVLKKALAEQSLATTPFERKEVLHKAITSLDAGMSPASVARAFNVTL